ncbi:hypothetical protein A8990_16310 [Paenibacillus taihuensis]|uniref:DUF2062 domain-containing protein n=1 Tax=Paenibacillus taihuensis TaxID=1156355 RepID=A0A3D9Q5S6_9BACL|nr:DUF2062 domain-containing protein [Paenibacillus taihuensis]REE56338.1 hypothetical protein A8990_16310 [Paenibacillus taihuensis]
MKTASKPRSIKRWLKLKYTQLMRAPGGPSFVALGFAIGIFVEMFTLPTYGLAFFLIFPLIYMMNASLAGALIGFVFGKIIFIPIAFVNSMIGGWVLPKHMKVALPLTPHWLDHLLYMNLKLIVGGIIDGVILGALFYFPVKLTLQYMANKRKEKRKLRRSAVEAKPVTE